MGHGRDVLNCEVTSISIKLLQLSLSLLFNHCTRFKTHRSRIPAKRRGQSNLHYHDIHPRASPTCTLVGGRPIASKRLQARRDFVFRLASGWGAARETKIDILAPVVEGSWDSLPTSDFARVDSSPKAVASLLPGAAMHKQASTK